MTVARGTAAVAVAVALVGFAAWLLGWSANLDPVEAVMGRAPIVEVPDLDGLARPRAVADVEAADLEAVVETSFSLSSPRGAVISQDPPAGDRVPARSEVTIVVSRGVTRVEMPDAVGRPIDDVVVPLDEAGVAYLVEREPSETVAEDAVIEQSPEPGRRVTAADEIRFVVSTGPDPRPVPPTAGLSPEGAAFALGRAGFVVAREDRDTADVDIGVVMGSEPAEGTVIDRDESVAIIVSAGPPPVAVPDLRNLDQEAAVARLESLGFAPNVVGGPPSGGVVVAQSIQPAEMLRPGQIVTIEISGG